MTNKLEIHGLDLTAIGIGDCGSPLCADDIFHRYAEGVAEQQLRWLLGSITFGPNLNWGDSFVMFDDSNITDEDDADWEYAE